MKRLITVLLLSLVAVSISGQPVRFINGDGSELTELCIAAATGASNANVLATRLGITNFTSTDVVCNGMPLNKFMRKYRNSEVEVKGTVIMSFQKTDNSPETELCYAAVTFSPDIEKIKAAYLRKYESFDKVRCNNIPFERFVEKYSVQIAATL